MHTTVPGVDSLPFAAANFSHLLIIFGWRVPDWASGIGKVDQPHALYKLIHPLSILCSSAFHYNMPTFSRTILQAMSEHQLAVPKGNLPVINWTVTTSSHMRDYEVHGAYEQDQSS